MRAVNVISHFFFVSLQFVDRNSVGRFEVICDSFQLIMCDENEVIRETCFIARYFVNDEIGSRH